MLFVSLNFLLFFICVYIFYWLFPTSQRKSVLLTASLFFYASWSVPFAFHFIFLIALNYYGINLYLARRREWIFFGIQLINLLNLIFFKYFYFIADQLSTITGIAQWSEPLLRFAHREAGYEILLPLAISFYTFQIMSYGFDMRRGVYSARHSLPDVLLYISFFPQLISGPIMRASDLLPQISRLNHDVRPDSNRMAKGFWLILIGVIKKIFVADMLRWTFGPIITRSSRPDDFYPHDIWITLFSLLMMLYADFSAYTDMARGFGFLFGIAIPINFRAPFRMHSFTELWKRWHLTFSSWIRDYIFIPLGGSRQGESRLYFNLIFTFLLAGLWHGASLTFAFWGFLMGIFLSIEAFLAKRGFPDLPPSMMGKMFRITVVWIIYISTGVFFFAPDWNWAVDSFAQMFDFREYEKNLQALSPDIYGRFVLALIAVVIFQAYEEKPRWFTWLRKYEIWLLPAMGAATLAVLTQIQYQAKDFFYFQF